MVLGWHSNGGLSFSSPTGGGGTISSRRHIMSPRIVGKMKNRNMTSIAMMAKAIVFRLSYTCRFSSGPFTLIFPHIVDLILIDISPRIPWPQGPGDSTENYQKYYPSYVHFTPQPLGVPPWYTFLSFPHDAQE